MFNALGLLGGLGSGGGNTTPYTGQSMIYGQNGQPAGFTSANSPMLLNWLFGGGSPSGANLPAVESISTGGNTYIPQRPQTSPMRPRPNGGSRPNGGGGGSTGGGSTGGGGVPGGGTGGSWEYPGLLNAPYTMTNWYGK